MYYLPLANLNTVSSALDFPKKSDIIDILETPAEPLHELISLLSLSPVGHLP